MHDITGVEDRECCTPAPHRSGRRLIGRLSVLVALALMGELENVPRAKVTDSGVPWM